MKTLNDLPVMVRTQHKEDPDWINVGDLRKVAIEWIKEYNKREFNPDVRDFIIEFFNIKGDFLKGEESESP